MSDRKIPPAAYKAYLAARIAEKEGKLAEARQLYRSVLRVDGDSVAAMVALGRIQCETLADSERWTAAEVWFSQARSKAPGYAPIYVERARCALRNGKGSVARHDAWIALELQPDSYRASELYAQSLRVTGAGKRAAARVRQGWLLWTTESGKRPRDVKLFDGEEAFDRSTTQDRAVEMAGLSFSQSYEQLDDALIQGSKEAIRQAAARLRLRPSDVAVRAAALGVWEQAEHYGLVVYRVDPQSSDAWAALLSVESVSQRITDDGLWAPSRQMLLGLSPLGVWVAADAFVRRGRLGQARALLELHGKRSVLRHSQGPVMGMLRARVLDAVEKSVGQ